MAIATTRRKLFHILLKVCSFRWSLTTVGLAPQERARGRIDRDGVRAPARALAQRGTGGDLRCPAAQGLARPRGGDVDRVRNFIKQLRAKLDEDAQSPTWIFNLRGVGYRMASPRDRWHPRLVAVGRRPCTRTEAAAPTRPRFPPTPVAVSPETAAGVPSARRPRLASPPMRVSSPRTFSRMPA